MSQDIGKAEPTAGVYRIDLGQARGREQRGRRMGLVVSPSESPLSVVTVIPSSTSARPAIHRPKLEIARPATRMLVDQIRSIDTGYLTGDPLTISPAARWPTCSSL
ncbi:MAG: type II toxin-antitoxin system PemK/MazF family toxin [Cumulibacter sp.]